MTISILLGVGQVPVQNSRESYNIKKCSPEKVGFIWHLQIDNVKKFYAFYFFVDLLTDLESLAIKFIF